MTEVNNTPHQDDASKNIVYISITKLYPHPDNPRKDIGDISELAESIKARGIMQNLTVVPGHSFTDGDNKGTVDIGDGGYTVVIGHRRLAAAKRAGITHVPCVVADMTYEEQIATMMLENMHRLDLTLCEQAYGMQIMLNLGDSISGISEKTGFSETTVRRKVKLAELDYDKLKSASSRQISIADIDKLNKIKSINSRNILLASIGTINFEYAYTSALRTEQQEEDNKKLHEVVKDYDITIISLEKLTKNGDDYRYCYTVRVGDEKKLDELNPDTEYFGTISHGCMSVYAKRVEDIEAKTKQEDRNRRIEEAKAALAEASATAFTLRKEYVKKYSKISAKAKLPELSRKMVNIVVNRRYFSRDLLCEVVGCKSSEELYRYIDTNPAHALFATVYASLDDSGYQDYYGHDAEYYKNTALDTIYEFLCSFGYQMSDVEKALQDGTSDMFLEKEPAEEDED